MTHGRCTDQDAARGTFGRVTHLKDGNLTSVTTGLNTPDDDFLDLNSLLRKQEFQQLETKKKKKKKEKGE